MSTHEPAPHPQEQPQEQAKRRHRHAFHLFGSHPAELHLGRRVLDKRMRLYDTARKQWCRLARRTRLPAGDAADPHWTGLFLQRAAWLPSPVQQWLEHKCRATQESAAHGGARLIPLELLSPAYQSWLRHATVRRCLTLHLRRWISQSQTEQVILGPLDYRLLLQTAYDLDLPDEYETVRTIALGVAHDRDWPWEILALWNNIF